MTDASSQEFQLLTVQQVAAAAAPPDLPSNGNLKTAQAVSVSKSWRIKPQIRVAVKRRQNGLGAFN